MKLIRRLLRTESAQSVMAWLAANYLRLVYRTTQWTVVRPQATERLMTSGQPYVACFWHGRMLLMRAALPPGSTIHILISRHRDGVLISRAVSHLGIHTIVGSSKQGTAALFGMQRLLRRGDSVAITPDGPRGPRMRAKAGAIKTAQLAHVPLVPISGAVNRRRILGSWDRFCLALPFGRGAVLFGEPIEVSRDADEGEIERLRLMLEERLNDLTADADRRYGQALIEPEAAHPAEDPARHARA